jgi:hypothetical protein
VSFLTPNLRVLWLKLTPKQNIYKALFLSSVMAAAKIKMQKKTLELIKNIKAILEEYNKEGIKITVRGLFYQLVARDIIPNNIKSYSKLSRDLSKARYNKLIGWDSIIDNSNFLHICNFFDNIENLLETAVNSYKLNRWEEQDYYLEVWVEKDALRNIVQPITQKYQINLFIPGGRVSTTMIYEATKRFREHDNKKRILLYLGDYDPCGLDMILRDIPKRINYFGNGIEIIQIALTKKQIEENNLPTDQITKTKDNNKDWYEELSGTSKCWELDALKPTIIRKIVEDNILKYLDLNLFEQVKEREQADIKKIIERLKER